MSRYAEGENSND